MINEEEPDEEESSFALSPEVSLRGIGRQIAAAESARNHVPFDKFGEHLNALVAFLTDVSGAST